MKKLITELLSTVCIFLLAACGPDKQTDYPAAIMVNGGNFNRKIGMPYARVEAGIAVYMDDTWYLCFPEGQGSNQGLSLPEIMPEGYKVC